MADTDGKSYLTHFYNLDAILSVGYRVNSVNATAFRRWATSVLKQQSQIDFFVRTSLPPVEGVFFDGQVWDAYELLSQLIRSALERIILIDNYIDDEVYHVGASIKNLGKNLFSLLSHI